jgi:hypothetical protein
MLTRYELALPIGEDILNSNIPHDRIISEGLGWVMGFLLSLRESWN